MTTNDSGKYTIHIADAIRAKQIKNFLLKEAKERFELRKTEQKAMEEDDDRNR